MSEKQAGLEAKVAESGSGMGGGMAAPGGSGSPFEFLGWTSVEGGRCGCAAYAVRPERLRMGTAATLYYSDRLMGVASKGRGGTLRENYAMLMCDAVSRSSRGIARVSVMRGLDPAGWGDDGLWLQFTLAEAKASSSEGPASGQEPAHGPADHAVGESRFEHVLVIPCQGGEGAFELGEMADGRPAPYPAAFGRR